MYHHLRHRATAAIINISIIKKIITDYFIKLSFT